MSSAAGQSGGCVRFGEKRENGKDSAGKKFFSRRKKDFLEFWRI
jgi:hypothetical protein